MQYLYCETENMAAFNCDSARWQPCAAKTEAAARRVAQRQRIFQRTIAHVAYVTADARVIPLAHRIDGKWVAAD